MSIKKSFKMEKENLETNRVILLITRKVRDELRNFCDNHKTIEGFKIRMGEFGDIAVIEKLERMKKRLKEETKNV